MMRILILVLLAVVFWGCGGNETTQQPEEKPSVDSLVKEQPAAERKPDTSTWFSTEKTASLEKKLGVNGYVGRALKIEGKVPEMKVEHLPCELWYGPGTLSIYRLEGKVAKLRVDWSVETAHSHIEYYFENDRLFLMDLYSRDYGNKEEAKQSYNYEQPEVVKHVAGRYYLDNEKVKMRIGTDWLAGEAEKPFTHAKITPEDEAVLNTTFENDMNNMRLIFEGKMKCSQLAEAGYFP